MFYLKLYKCIIVKHIAHTTLIFVYGILFQERKVDLKSSFEDLHAGLSVLTVALAVTDVKFLIKS